MPTPQNPSIGLCENCRHAQVITTSRGSMFYRCTLADVDPRFVKYPRLPVLSCPGYEPTPPLQP